MEGLGDTANVSCWSHLCVFTTVSKDIVTFEWSCSLLTMQVLMCYVLYVCVDMCVLICVLVLML